MSNWAHRAGRGRWTWCGVGLLLVGGLCGSAPVAAPPAGAATTHLATVTISSPDATTYQISFRLNQTTDTPALLAIASPGVGYPHGTDTTSFALRCTFACTGAPHPAASVWGATGGLHPLQTGASSVVLNLFANGISGGTFGAGAKLTLTLTTVTKPASGGSIPVSVATESAPGVVAESGTTVTSPAPPNTATAIGVAAAATPNSLAYPHASWMDQISELNIAPGVTGAGSLYAPGATFPTAGADYVASTCAFTETGTSVVTSACTGVTVSPDASTTTGLPGTAAMVDIVAGPTTPPAVTTVTGLTLTIAGVTNPSGAGATAGAVLAGEGTTTFTDLVGAGTGTLTLVASPSIDLSSTDFPVFPSSMRSGTTTAFGLDIANVTNYSWPGNGTSLSFTLAGIANLSPANVGLKCAYEAGPTPGPTTPPPFTFTTEDKRLVSNAVDVPLDAGATLELDCQLTLSQTVLGGTLNLEAVLDDNTGSTPFVLATASAMTLLVPAPATGYTLGAADGGIFAFGTDTFYGSMGGKPLNAPIVGMAAPPTGQGYWLVASDGGIFAFGSARFYGSMGGKPLNAPIVAMAATPTGGGYWLVASDGGIFTFGNATFYGSMGGKSLNAPIVGMAAEATGRGYWLVASDGGVFIFGDAPFDGSMGGKSLNAPIVAMAAAPTGQGYWLVASDGGIFTFGAAPFEGSAGSIALNKPIVAMLPTFSGDGYWLVASDGGVFTYGDATFEGSTGSLQLVAPVVAAS
jgi:hypothetical protein